MSDDRTARINAAVDECLDRCSKASTPPAITVQGFCAELRQRGWNENDIEVVESRATRILVQRTLGQ